MPPLDRVMSFGDHLEELRRRVVHALAGIVVLFGLALYFGGPLLEMIAAPLLAELRSAGQSPTMLATSPLEAFGSYIKVATVAALVLGMPWLLYQLWLFVAPGLYPREQRFAYFLLPMSGVLTAAGLAVLYFVILPISLYFLISFGSGLMDRSVPTVAAPAGVEMPGVPVLEGDPAESATGSMWINRPLGQLRVRTGPGEVMGLTLVHGGVIAQQYRVSEYVNLVFLLGLAFAVAFQVPLVMLLLSWAGIITPADVVKRRKHVILGCVVGAALLPTQDPWSLLLLSGMLIGLFEFGVMLMRFVPARRVAGTKAGTDAEAEA
jgi:sec-independent protein translocase protein TatC